MYMYLARHTLQLLCVLQLRYRYEQSIQERNDLGLQLIERNEEVCVFYEKLNVQESVIRQANLELTAREEELQFLRVEVGRPLIITQYSYTGV